MSNRFMKGDGLNNISLRAGEKLVITKDTYRSYNMPLYERMGVIEDESLLDKLHGFSKPVFDAYMEVYRARSKVHNLAVLSAPKDKVAANNRTRSLNVLEKADIIRKVPAAHLRGSDGYIIKVPKFCYMINPYFLIPQRNEHFTLACGFWVQLKSKVAKSRE